jgi:hypothetical protein
MHTLVLALNPSIDAEWRVKDVLSSSRVFIGGLMD